MCANIPMTIRWNETNEKYIPFHLQFFLFFAHKCVHIENVLNFVVWHVCRANEGYKYGMHIYGPHTKVPMTRRQNIRTHTPTSNSSTNNNRKKIFPLVLKYAQSIRTPRYGWKLFCIADADVRLSEHWWSKTIGNSGNSSCRCTENKKSILLRRKYLSIWFESIIRIFGVSIINICLSQLLTHLIRLS